MGWWLEGDTASWDGFLTLAMLYHVFTLMVETDKLGMIVGIYRSKLHEQADRIRFSVRGDRLT